MTLPGVCLVLLVAAQQENSVERLVRQLGHDQAKVREEAARGLVEIGKPALPLLHEAARSGDSETRARALEVLKGIERRLLNGQNLWTRPGKALTPLVHHSGRLYYATASEAEEKGTLVCLDAATGLEEWSTALAGPAADLRAHQGFLHYQQGDQFFADARTGKTLSSFHIPFVGSPRLELIGSIAVAVHSAWPFGVRAFDVDSGRPLWERRHAEIGWSLPLGSFQKACLVYEVQKVVALDSETGRPLWEHALSEDERRVFSSGSPGPEHRVLFDDRSIYFSGSKVLKWDFQGRAVWNAAEIKNLNGYGPRLLAQDGKNLYGAMTDSRIVALTKADGALAWLVGERRDEWTGICDMELVDGRLLALTSLDFSKGEQNFVLRRLDPDTGKVLWTLPCARSPLPRHSFKGGIYLAGKDGLYRADLETGKSVRLDRPVPNAHPLLVGDTLYVSSTAEVTAIKLTE